MPNGSRSASRSDYEPAVQIPGLSLVGLLAFLLPWAAWHFALSDTFGAWRECGRLERRWMRFAPTTPATERPCWLVEAPN